MTKTFKRANDAYEYYHDKIIREGVNFGDTKALFNVGFYIENPMDNFILNGERKWNPVYAEAEWNGIYPKIEILMSWVEYMAKYRKYGNVWLMLMVMLILIMVGNGNVTIKLIM